METVLRKTARHALAAAVVASLALTATASLMLTAGTASAPEPVRLTQELGSSSGFAPGYYTVSTASTTVLNWPGTWTPGSVAAGTPCSTTYLPAGATTDKVIYAYGNYRKCV